MAEIPGNRNTATIPQLNGFPGQQTRVTIATVRGGESSTPVGLPGNYRVTIVLGLDRTIEASINLKTDGRGDSLLWVPAEYRRPETHLVMHRGFGSVEYTFHVIASQTGMVTSLETTIAADSFVAAERAARIAAETMLNEWSTALEVPLAIQQIVIQELSTMGQHTTARTAFRPVSVSALPPMSPPSEFNGLAALYAESLTTRTRNYEFLCLVRIIEKLYTDRSKSPVSPIQYDEHTRIDEQFPANIASFQDWLGRLFPFRSDWDTAAVTAVARPEIVGKKFGAVYEKHLWPLRGSIAHAIGVTNLKPDAQYSSIPEQFLQAEAVEYWLPATRCLARVLLHNSFPELVRIR